MATPAISLSQCHFFSPQGRPRPSAGAFSANTLILVFLTFVNTPELLLLPCLFSISKQASACGLHFQLNEDGSWVFVLSLGWVRKSTLFANKFTWHLQLHVQSYLKYEMSQTDHHKTSTIAFSISYCKVSIQLTCENTWYHSFFYPWSLSFSYTFRSLYQEILLALLPKQIEPNSLWPLPPAHKCLNSYHLSVGQLPWPLAIILHIKGVLRLYHLQFFLTVQKSVQASPKGFREHVNNITALIGRGNKIE